MTTIQEAVQNGIDYLNEVKPDWLEKINLDTLFISKNTGAISPSNCVCTQVFGFWDNAPAINGNNHVGSLPEYGFQDTCKGWRNCEEWSYEDLREEWTKRILELRK